MQAPGRLLLARSVTLRARDDHRAPMAVIGF